MQSLRTCGFITWRTRCSTKPKRTTCRSLRWRLDHRAAWTARLSSMGVGGIEFNRLSQPSPTVAQMWGGPRQPPCAIFVRTFSPSMITKATFQPFVALTRPLPSSRSSKAICWTRSTSQKSRPCSTRRFRMPCTAMSSASAPPVPAPCRLMMSLRGATALCSTFRTGPASRLLTTTLAEFWPRR